MTSSAAPHRLAWALALISAPALGQSLIVVDDDGPADFADLPGAVAAAQDGDILLVRAGSYSGFATSGKGLVIQGDGEVLLQGSVAVSDLPGGSAFVLRGLERSGGSPLSQAPGLAFEDCAGAVLVEECTVTYGAPAVSLVGCADATLVGCDLSGSQADNGLGLAPWPAVAASASQVALYGGQSRGGTGLVADCFGGGTAAGQGAPAVDLVGSVLFVDGATILGGTGGDGCEDEGTFQCVDGGPGGDGLFVDLASTAIDLGGGSFDGGPGGIPGNGQFHCMEGFPGGPWSGPGPVLFLNEESRECTLASPLVTGQPATLHLQGNPGDAVFLMLGVPGAPFLFKPGLLGVLASPGFLSVTFLGTVGLPPILDLPISGPSVAPFDAAAVVVQGFFVSTDGRKHLSPPTHVTVLAP